MCCRWFPLLLAIGSMASVAAPLGDAQPIVEIKVNGRQLTAPASVMVTSTVLPDERNRALAVSAESRVYLRRSTIELDGAYEARMHQTWITDLPEGDYVITAQVLGREGVRARTHAELKVVGQAPRK